MTGHCLYTIAGGAAPCFLVLAFAFAFRFPLEWFLLSSLADLGRIDDRNRDIRQWTLYDCLQAKEMVVLYVHSW